MPLCKLHVLRMLVQLLWLARHAGTRVAVQTGRYLWRLSGELRIDEVMRRIWRHGREDVSVCGEELVGLKVVP